jgi:hypothetical protein
MTDELDRIVKEAASGRTGIQPITLARITGVPAEIRTENLPNRSLGHYLYTLSFTG